MREAGPPACVLGSGSPLALLRLCRTVGFWKQNLHIGPRKINHLRLSPFLFSVMCDRAASVLTACKLHCEVALIGLIKWRSVYEGLGLIMRGMPHDSTGSGKKIALFLSLRL